MSCFINIEDVELRSMVPGGNARIVHSEHMTLAHWYFEKDAILPEHSHPHEQISVLIRGRFEMTVGGESCIMVPGTTLIIPPHVLHTGTALEESFHIDVFYPVREEYR